MRRTEIRRVLLAWAIALLCAGVSYAAGIETGRHGGDTGTGNQTPECLPDGGDGSTDNECITDIGELGNGERGDDCLEDPNGQTGGNSHVEAPVDCTESDHSAVMYTEPIYDRNNDQLGWEITFSNGGEVRALCHRETQPRLESVRIWVDRTTHMARIAKLEADLVLAGRGEIEVELNGQLFVFGTGLGGPNAFNVNNEIYNTIGHAGYAIFDTGDFWTIHGVNDVRFSSNDRAVQSSMVSVEPVNDNNYSWCFPEDGGFSGSSGLR